MYPIIVLRRFWIPMNNIIYNVVCAFRSPIYSENKHQEGLQLETRDNTQTPLHILQGRQEEHPRKTTISKVSKDFQQTHLKTHRTPGV